MHLLSCILLALVMLQGMFILARIGAKWYSAKSQTLAQYQGVKYTYPIKNPVFIFIALLVAYIGILYI